MLTISLKLLPHMVILVLSIRIYLKLLRKLKLSRSVYKASDHVQRQGASFLESAAYTVVCEHF